MNLWEKNSQKENSQIYQTSTAKPCYRSIEKEFTNLSNIRGKTMLSVHSANIILSTNDWWRTPQRCWLCKRWYSCWWCWTPQRSHISCLNPKTTAAAPKIEKRRILSSPRHSPRRHSQLSPAPPEARAPLFSFVCLSLSLLQMLYKWNLGGFGPCNGQTLTAVRP